MLSSFEKVHSLAITNWNLTQHKVNTNNLIITLLQNNWGPVLTLNPFFKKKLGYVNRNLNTLKINKPLNPFYNNFTTGNIKLAGVSSNIDYNPTYLFTKKPKTLLSKSLKNHLLHLFRSFIRVNMTSQNELTIPHYTFRYFYLLHTKGGLTIITLPKLFHNWKNVYFLLYNLYYHKINLLTFAPSFFKTEVLALNWVFSKKFQFMWRYTRPFLVYKPNKITNHGDFVFRNLRALKLSTGIVIDVLYHMKTIYYLRRTSFYSIGLVPTIYNAYTVDLALPTAYESVFTQIFFVRFLMRIKQDASSTEFSNLRQIWNTPLTLTKYIPNKVGTLDTTYSTEDA